ncbi:hypothetical protein [Glycocaulis sp.]|uniref:hypothetical protein n=1 Tax=Glycocaulis sp. TaxID=1969725 RepID=UPI003F9EC9B9
MVQLLGFVACSLMAFAGLAGASAACSLMHHRPFQSPYAPHLIDRTHTIVLARVLNTAPQGTRPLLWDIEPIRPHTAYFQMLEVLKGAAPERLELRYDAAEPNPAWPDIFPAESMNFWRQPTNLDMLSINSACQTVRRLQSGDLYIFFLDSDGALVSDRFNRTLVPVRDGNDPWLRALRRHLSGMSWDEAAPSWTVQELIEIYPAMEIETTESCAQPWEDRWQTGEMTYQSLRPDSRPQEAQGNRNEAEYPSWYYGVELVSRGRVSTARMLCRSARVIPNATIEPEICELAEQPETWCVPGQRHLVIAARRDWRPETPPGNFQLADRIPISDDGYVDFADLPREFRWRGQTRFHVDEVEAMLARAIAE